MINVQLLDYIGIQLSDFDGGYVQSMASYKLFGKLSSFAIECSEFPTILGQAWNNYRNMISLPNK